MSAPKVKWKTLRRHPEGIDVQGGNHAYWSLIYRVGEEREWADGPIEHRERWEQETFYVHDHPLAAAWHRVALTAIAELRAASQKKKR